MSNEILIENARLREALAKVGGFANSWQKFYKDSCRGARYVNPHDINSKLALIEQTCKAALETPAAPQAPLTYVMVGGKVYSGTLIDDNPEHFEGCIEIEVVDIDPTCARMRVIGTPTGKVNEPPEVVGEIS